MAKKASKEDKEIEKKVVNKQKENEQQLFSQRELAEMFGLSITEMNSLYLIRGISEDEKLGYKEAYKLFNNIG